MTLPFGRNWRVTKEPLDESERREWKSWLKTQHSKTKIMASSPITSWQIDEETVETVSDFILFSSVQSLSRVQLFATPWTAACQASPTPGAYSNSCPLSWWCHPTISSLSSPSPPVLNLSQHQGLFKGVSFHIRWPKYWSFSFNISPSSEHAGLIFRMDWLDLLAVQGTLKSLPQHHSSKASVLQRSAFFIVQLSHPYMTTGKTIALTRWTFAGFLVCYLGWS